MIHNRPPRIEGFSYVGLYRYHASVTTWNRRPHLTAPETARIAREQLLRLAPKFGTAVLAYCFMPDHAHVLIEGSRDDARPLALIDRWKQATGFWFCRQRGERLWQPGYYERTLREREESRVVARYILENPLRAGLVEDPRKYPYSWCVWEGDLTLGERR